MKKKLISFWIVAALMAVLMGVTVCGTSQDSSGADEPNRLEEIQERGKFDVATEPYFALNEFIDLSKEGQD